VIRELAMLVARLLHEIQTQRNLMAAERGEYRLQLKPVAVPDLLREVAQIATGRAGAGDHPLQVSAGPELTITTDRTLLCRVLTNMVKNAIEAVAPGEQVRLWCEASPQQVTLRVHNPGTIPERAARRVFQRSFTTKRGVGRGLGTYSMKLFGEQYLQGKVGFTSSPETGTEFFIHLPHQCDR
jgi:signal transduction histidine kinase